MSTIAFVNSVSNVCAGNTIDQVKNGAATSFLQIREGLGANRVLKPKAKKKKKGETRQCQTGMCVLHIHSVVVHRYYESKNVTTLILHNHQYSLNLVFHRRLSPDAHR